MHNKLFVADNVMAVTGGRNIGDEYFMYASAANFIDMDAFVVGDIVRDLSEVFDRYWNSAYVYPLAAFVADDPHAAAGPRARRISALRNARAAGGGCGRRARLPSGRIELERGKLDLIWAPAMVFADSPLKVTGLTEGGMHTTVTSNLMHVMDEAKEEVIVISPYFIPGKIGMEAIRRLSERHVRMVLVTNSLAASDAPLVHIGYSHYRKAMLKLGVEIYEINPERMKQRNKIFEFGSSRAMLHAKIAVIDHKQVFVGSMNSDPRSSRDNTRNGHRRGQSENGRANHFPDAKRRPLRQLQAAQCRQTQRLRVGRQRPRRPGPPGERNSRRRTRGRHLAEGHPAIAGAVRAGRVVLAAAPGANCAAQSTPDKRSCSVGGEQAVAPPPRMKSKQWQFLEYSNNCRASLKIVASGPRSG